MGSALAIHAGDGGPRLSAHSRSQGRTAGRSPPTRPSGSGAAAGAADRPAASGALFDGDLWARGFLEDHGFIPLTLIATSIDYRFTCTPFSVLLQ